MDKRAKVIELIALMKLKTVANGCTPGEAAKFAAKCAELIEKYQIDEAEIAARNGEPPQAEIEVCEHILRTGKKVFNPGMTAVVSGLARGMCCRVILMHRGYGDNVEAVYGVIGDQMDATYVCQLATSVIPALRTMAILEGAEHGYEKAGLVRWSNQYLTGAGSEIYNRLIKERSERSEAKKREVGASSSALSIITGDSLATLKRNAVEEAFKAAYPRTKKTYSRSEYDHTAVERGREAGRNVNLNRSLEG